MLFFQLGFEMSVRSSHKPLFVRMTPLQSDWSSVGLKGIIPSLLHHTLMGYNFLIPDAVGNTTVYSRHYNIHRGNRITYAHLIRY